MVKQRVSSVQAAFVCVFGYLRVQMGERLFCWHSVWGGVHMGSVLYVFWLYGVHMLKAMMKAMLKVTLEATPKAMLRGRVKCNAEGMTWPDLHCADRADWDAEGNACCHRIEFT